ALWHFLIGLNPVVDETALHLRYYWPAKFKVAFAPMVGVLSIAKPFVANTDTPGKAYLAIDDQQFAMAAIVHTIEVVPVQWPKNLYYCACFAHVGNEIGIHRAGAYAIEQNPHLDTV